MYTLCSRRQFLYQKGKLGPARTNCESGYPHQNGGLVHKDELVVKDVAMGWAVLAHVEL